MSHASPGRITGEVTTAYSLAHAQQIEGNLPIHSSLFLKQEPQRDKAGPYGEQLVCLLGNLLASNIGAPLFALPGRQLFTVVSNFHTHGSCTRRQRPCKHIDHEANRVEHEPLVFTQYLIQTSRTAFSLMIRF